MDTEDANIQDAKNYLPKKFKKLFGKGLTTLYIFAIIDLSVREITKERKQNRNGN